MINRLINMEVPTLSRRTIDTPMNKGIYSIEDYATTFINGLGETQRIRFKKMLENGIKCGMSIANNYGVDYEQFINEVKKQMEVV